MHVLGTTVEAQIDLNTNIDPPHLDMSVPSQPGSPVVKHIFKFVDGDLYLVSPYLVPPSVRPSTFEGPGLVVMKSGAVQKTEDEKNAMARADAMSPDEKTINF